jgi:hypothetical protein
MIQAKTSIAKQIALFYLMVEYLPLTVYSGPTLINNTILLRKVSKQGLAGRCRRRRKSRTGKPGKKT